jgi:nitroreductase
MISLLQERVSYPANALAEPAPNTEQLNEILKCAVSAPDHARMTPWEFIVIQGDARVTLGQVFARATQLREPDVSDKKLESIAQKPLRSPMIIVIIAKVTPNHPKTPVIEQLLSAGAAAQQMSLGANALGFGATWLSGPNTYDSTVKAALNISATDEVVGFLYIGTPTMKKPDRPRPDPAEFTRHWTGE